jgi:hypothetical protein
MISIPHLFYIKQGDTFILEGVSPVTLADTTIHAHIRTKEGTLVAMLIVEITGFAIRLTTPSTATFPIGVLYMDLLLENNSVIHHTQTISFECIPAITRL